MTTNVDLERQLRAHFEARADRRASDGQRAAIFERTAGLGQRPAWLAALRSSTMSVTSLAVRPAIPRQAWLLVAVGLLIAGLAAAAVIGRPPTPKPPINGLIVFGRMNEALGDTVVYTIWPDGTHERQVRPETHEGPFWSPDGSKLGLGHAVSNPDGSNYQVWDQSANPFHVECWDWSPDGLRMLCEGFLDNEELDAEIHGVYSVRASDGGDLQRIDLPGQQSEPGAYSRDGTQVVYSGLVDGTRRTIVANVDGTNRHAVGAVEFFRSSWSPDGASLLATRDAALWSIDLATGGQRQIWPNDNPNAWIFDAKYSPDGSRILFRRYVAEGDVDLWTMAIDGSDPIQVTSGPEDDRFLDWGTHPLE
jgi:hypothetical protein